MSELGPVVLHVWSDYLCPWCNVAAVRLRKIEAEFGARVELRWKSFLLRPQPEPERDLEKFRRYTEGWRRAAEEEPDAEFRVWQSDEGPPTHSVPSHLLAKAAATFGPDAFERVHEALLHAYFAENRDISRAPALRAIWAGAGLDEAELVRVSDPALLRQVSQEHNQAVELGVGGVPAVMMDGTDIAITGAQPVELYRRWIQKRLDEAAT
jgi:predicted DsbA family dithiol-disulfide isomerase